MPWQAWLVVKLDLDLKLYLEGKSGTALIPTFTIRFVLGFENGLIKFSLDCLIGFLIAGDAQFKSMTAIPIHNSFLTAFPYCAALYLRGHVTR